MNHPIIATILTATALALAATGTPLAQTPGNGVTGEALAYPIVDTGQMACYDNSALIACPESGQAFYGQDSQCASAAPAYRDNGDGTVTDLVTGLTWQQNYDNRPHSWTEALSLVSALNQQKLGGYSDWRLPTIKELYSLWYASTGWPYIDTAHFPLGGGGGQNDGHTIFFSGTQYAGRMETTSSTTPGDHPGAEMVFGVNFDTGHIKGYSIDSSSNPPTPQHFFRFVRGNASYGVNAFQNNGDGTETSGQSVTETLPAGSHTVKLTAADAAGAVATSTRTLTVAAAVAVAGVAKATNPFRLKVSGSGFQPGCSVKIDGSAAPTTACKSSTLVVAKGSGLGAMVTKGATVQITVVNPDGGASAQYPYTR